MNRYLKKYPFIYFLRLVINKRNNYISMSYFYVFQWKDMHKKGGKIIYVWDGIINYDMVYTYVQK